MAGDSESARYAAVNWEVCGRYESGIIARKINSRCGQFLNAAKTSHRHMNEAPRSLLRTNAFESLPELRRFYRTKRE